MRRMNRENQRLLADELSRMAARYESTRGDDCRVLFDLWMDANRHVQEQVSNIFPELARALERLCEHEWLIAGLASRAAYLRANLEGRS